MMLSVALGVAAWTTTDALDRTLAASLATSASPLDAGADFHVGRGDAGVPAGPGRSGSPPCRAWPRSGRSCCVGSC